ncbi:MAG: polyketide synthase, partial [Desulfobacteraceae bacterium]
MRDFEPIAIIGRGCILPGCASPDAVWETVRKGRVHISGPAAGAWRISHDKVLPERKPGLLCTDRGGYISGFEALFDPDAYGVEKSLVTALDPLFQWTLFAAGQALEDAGYRHAPVRSGTGVILGNLSYPTASFTRLSEEFYMDILFAGGRHRTGGVHPLNRFMSGMPALIVKRALGLGGEAFALDAACASALYAVKLACDALATGRADLMLAGGVNAADALFIHAGFSVLRAMSPSGRSRPFHHAADGLIPAEGAAFVALKRLGDALRDRDAIHGVIRGIGLSNDGRAGGFLLPSTEGQVRCMEAAFRCAGLEPRDISFVECHATGTPGGDAVEVLSLGRTFAGCRNVALGSLKANLGHSITASGAAGLIKVLECFRHETIAGTPDAHPLLEELERSAFRVPASPEPWTVSRRCKAACVSSFGFGGNNAHLIVEAREEAAKVRPLRSAGVKDSAGEAIAVVGLAVRTDKIADTAAFAEFLATGAIPGEKPRDAVRLAKNDLAFPPLDLGRCLGQQLLLLAAASDALAQVRRIDGRSAGVFIGMGADAETNRYGLRWRLADLLAEQGIEKDAAWVEAAARAVMDDLDAA